MPTISAISTIRRDNSYSGFEFSVLKKVIRRLELKEYELWDIHTDIMGFRLIGNSLAHSNIELSNKNSEVYKNVLFARRYLPRDSVTETETRCCDGAKEPLDFLRDWL